ncbi:MAG: alpha/beta hydrolase fold-domain-containing protein [Piptocephalis tieghemiana]|nr:MAG: alpha/beta hydrolase fold-domain-containing protein [Piptocephalis tieghemiana]
MERARSLTVSLGLYNVAKEEQNRIIPPLSSIPPVSGEWIRWGGPVVHSNLATEGAILFLHGGGFFMGSAKSHRAINFRLSRASGKSIFSANYRLAPEHPFPAALEDAIAAFMYMTMEMDIPAHRIILCGDSAGGCLAVQVSMALRDMDQAIPGGVVMWSPWLDVMHSSPSIDSASADYLPDPRRQLGPCPGLWDGVHYYAPEPDMLRHPWVSPHYKEDLSGLPPMLIQCGQAERLRDEAVSFAARASLDRQDQGHVYEDMPHVWHNFATVPLAQEALDRTANFTQVVLDDSVKEGKDDGTRIGWGKWKVGHGGIVSPYHHDE